MKTKKVILALAVIAFVSCKKEGLGGKAKITGAVLHHDTPIPNAIVYIKYGTKESAGTDGANYDASVNADANAKFEFPDLQKGDYYLYATGYDSNISANVKGGNPVEIKKKTENKNNDVQVVE